MSIASKLTKLETDIASAYTSVANKNGTIPTDKNTNNLSTAIDSIPTGSISIVPKDVNFYNPLGELLYSYTTQEALALESMPEVPTIEGMTTTGWNYSYADMIGQVQSMGVADIGCQYYWTDKTTRFYMNIDNPSYLYPYFSFRLNGTITIDWGDGNTETITASQSLTVDPTVIGHQYATTGNYVIKMHHDTNSTEIALGEYLSAAKFLYDGTDVNNYVYRDYLYRLDLYCPDSAILKFSQIVSDARNVKVIYSRPPINITNCFSLVAFIQNIPSNWNATAPSVKFCTNLELLLISSSARNFGTSNSMRNIGLPNRLIIPYKIFDTATVRAYTGQFGNDYSIEEIYLPDDYPDISGCFNSCFNLKKVVFGNITNVGNGTFQNCLNLTVFNFLKCTAVPTLSNVNSFSIANAYMATPTNRKILVPYNLYSSWITATNWASLIDMIYLAGKFNAGDTLPSGYTWYKDEKHTIPVSSATAPDTGIYYAEVS